MKKRIKTILQLTSTECGICCVAMICRYFGKIKPLGYYRSYIQCGRDGVTVKEVMSALDKLGVEARLKHFSIEECRKQGTPFLLIMDSKHFVVAQSYKKDVVMVYDPAIGKMAMRIEEFEKRAGKYIITTKITELFIQEREVLGEWKEFIRILLSEKKLLTMEVVLSLFVYIGIVTMPLLIQYFIDSMLVSYYFEPARKLIFIGIASVLTYIIVSIIKSFVSVILESHIDSKFLFKVIDKMINLPYSFYEVRPGGDLLTRLNLLNSIKNMVSSISLAAMNIVGVIFAIIYSFLISTQMSMVAVIILCVVIVAVGLINIKMVDLNYYELAEMMDLNMVEAEFVNSMFEIRALHFEQQFRNKIESYYAKYACRFKHRNWWSKIYAVLLQFIQLFIPFFIFLFNLQNMNCSLGHIVGFYSISSLLVSNAVTLIEKWTEIRLAKNSLARINEILIEKELVNGNEKMKTFEKLEMEDVIFSYTGNSTNVLRGVNIKVNRGEKIAIVGNSGAGKSTIVKLLLGLYEPQKGEVLYNSKNILMYDRREFADKVGVVTQDVALFNNTIRENIVMSRTGVEQDELYRVLENVGILDEIMQMPMKENTLISDFGRNISGGQRQRLAMARTLINEPELMILDEATSSLDGLNEEEIVEFLESIDCAQIIISHRLSTIRKANYIYVIKEGAVIEEGKFEDLSKETTYFYNLFRTQLERGI